MAVPTDHKESRMTTSTTTSAQHAANVELWRRSAASLYAGDIDAFLECWHEDARYEVVYPVAGSPPLVQGRAALREMFTGFAALATTIAVHDVEFHQTTDPGVAFVQERMVAELHDGGHYENQLCIRVTFRDGLIASMLEYYGQDAHTELLRRIALAAAPEQAVMA